MEHCHLKSVETGYGTIHICTVNQSQTESEHYWNDLHYLIAKLMVENASRSGDEQRP